MQRYWVDFKKAGVLKNCAEKTGRDIDEKKLKPSMEKNSNS